MHLAEVPLNLSFVFVESILQNDQWVLELDVEPCAERALLQLGKDVRVQNRPIGVKR